MAQEPLSLTTAGWDWSSVLTDRELNLYRNVLEQVQRRGLSFALGGGLAASYYTGRMRFTKDMDLIILPQDRAVFIEALTRLGFEDLYHKQPYKRSWIYRGVRDDIIVDLIWQMANDRAIVDERWLTHGPQFQVSGLPMRLIPIEELIWSKLYIMHRDRCDWPDILNMLYLHAQTLDWDHLLNRVGVDRTLLSGLMCVFRWLCPDRAQRLPAELWAQLGLTGLPSEPLEWGGLPRATLLDSYHDWFGPKPSVKPPGEPSGEPPENLPGAEELPGAGPGKKPAA